MSNRNRRHGLFWAIGFLSLCAPSYAQSPLPDKAPIIHRDMGYAAVADAAHRLDLYLPKDHKGLIPVVLWIHGGGWIMGDKANAQLLPLVNLGYAIVSMNYRFSQDAIFPAQIYDCKAAVRWLRANAATYQLDPNKIAVGGDSAGGHLAALLGTTANDPKLEGNVGSPGVSTAVRAVCDYYGPTDLVSIEGQCTREQIEIVQPVLKQLFGGSPTEKPDLAHMASPRLHVSATSCPFFIVHGDHDEMVPLQQSIDLNEALKKAGVESTLDIIKGGRHGVMDPVSVQEAIRFMRRQLQGP